MHGAIKVTKSKQISSKAGVSGLGGKSKMFGQMGVQPSQPGVSAPSSAPAAGNQMIKGGGKAMAGFTPAKPAQPGKVSVC